MSANNHLTEAAFGLERSNCQLLPGSAYVEALRASIIRSRRYFYATQFLTDVRPIQDPYGEMRAIAHELGRAAWRGVSVKLVLNQTRVTDLQFDANYPFAAFLARRGVEVRAFSGHESGRAEIHSKLVVSDDRLLIVGSHNWTANAFYLNAELSLQVLSTPLAMEMRGTFESIWNDAVLHST